jgi:hypothetical protein
MDRGSPLRKCFGRVSGQHQAGRGGVDERTVVRRMPGAAASVEKPGPDPHPDTEVPMRGLRLLSAPLLAAWPPPCATAPAGTTSPTRPARARRGRIRWRPKRPRPAARRPVARAAPRLPPRPAVPPSRPRHWRPGATTRRRNREVGDGWSGAMELVAPRRAGFPRDPARANEFAAVNPRCRPSPTVRAGGGINASATVPAGEASRGLRGFPPLLRRLQPLSREYAPPPASRRAAARAGRRGEGSRPTTPFAGGRGAPAGPRP